MGIPQFTLTKACCLRFLDNHAGGWVRQHFCHRARPHSRFGAFHRGRSRHLFLSPPSCRVGVSAATVRLTPYRKLTHYPKRRQVVPSQNYFKVTLSLNGKACDDPPTMKEYSPRRSFHPSAASSKIDRYLASTATLTSLLSPGFNFTLLQPTNRFGGSPALPSNAGYTCAISTPARLPVFFTFNVNVVSLPGVTFKPE